MSGIPVQPDFFEQGPFGHLRVAVAAQPSESVATGELKRFNGSREVHRHSREAFNSTATMRHDRRAIVLGLFQDNPALSFTDRQALNRLYPGSGDMNMVRPRITELIESGYLIECGSVSCPVTGKTVRECRLNRTGA